MSSPAGPATFQPSGVITLTTDFGHADPFVGVMKGQVLTRFPAAQLVDLTHSVTVHRPGEAGFWLARAFGYFPPGTVHVAVVDPGVGGTRQIAVVEGGGHLFLAPDNGLLEQVQSRLPAPVVLRHLEVAGLGAIGLRPPSATFHGRDIFAPIAAEVAAGRLAPERLGSIVPALVPGDLPGPRLDGDSLTGTVVTIDHFGNLLTNVDERWLAGMTTPMVRAGGREIAFRRTYADAPTGDYVALVNSFGVLEIARVEMSAADGLGLGRGDPIVVVAGRG